MPRYLSAINYQYGGGYFNFEVNRIVRLLPPLLVAGLFCMLLGYFVMLPDDYENLSQSVIATNGFANNILAAITTKDYWEVSNDYKPLMHTWYVGVIFQFYFVYPLLFYMANYKNNQLKTLLTLISVLGAISLLYYFSITDVSHLAERFYYMPSRFYEFAVGGIAALIYKPQDNKPFGRNFVYISYVVLLLLLFGNVDLIPSYVRLVAVVALSCILICSKNVLENNVTGNIVIAKIGAASYSIFIWHQILLAFYRYTITSEFTIGSYAVLLLGTILMSWLSYIFIEQGVTNALKSKTRKHRFYAMTVLIFVALTSYSGFIYMKAGVVRDVPELEITKQSIHRGMHAEYCDRGYQYDKDFSTGKKHWLVIGNSFGRDFVNTILESPIADSVEVSYVDILYFKNEEYNKRFALADRVFISSYNIEEKTISEIEINCKVNNFPTERIVIVGEKNFGKTNGVFYMHRNSPSYYAQRTKVDMSYLEKNKKFSSLYGKRYLDLFSLVIDEKGTVPVFTPDKRFISQDCKHFCKGGALYFSQLIDWSKYLD